MSLKHVVANVVSTEQPIRLQHGLALKWTSDRTGGTMSLSRQGDKPPSDEEVRIVMRYMVEALPPHSVDIDKMVYKVESNQVVRLYVFWENEHE